MKRPTLDNFSIDGIHAIRCTLHFAFHFSYMRAVETLEDTSIFLGLSACFFVDFLFLVRSFLFFVSFQRSYWSLDGLAAGEYTDSWNDISSARRGQCWTVYRSRGAAPISAIPVCTTPSICRYFLKVTCLFSTNTF